MQVGNIQLGIPVRVTRRNIEQDAICGAVFIYDGLYNVVGALPCSCLSPMHNFTTPRFSSLLFFGKPQTTVYLILLGLFGRLRFSAACPQSALPNHRASLPEAWII